jgi:hypothetical protein
MPITFTVTGDFNSIEDFLNHVKNLNILSILESCGEMGVTALSSATPHDTGLAAGSWGYDVQANDGVYSIAWTNTDIENGFPVSIMLQYGYATGTGGYVQGRDYINPAMAPIFDYIANKVWTAVTSK